MCRITLLWLCCSLAPTPGEDLPFAAINAASQREAKLKILSISWKANSFVPNGGRMDADPGGLPLPRADVTVESTHKLILDGNRFRVEHNDAGLRKQVPADADSVETFDGERSYVRYFLEGRDKPPHLILEHKPRALGGLTVGAIMLWCRGSEREPLRSPGTREPVVVPHKTDDPVLVIRVGKPGESVTTYFLDPRREYVVVRVRREGFGTVESTEIEYHEHPAHGWVPSAWTTVKTRAGAVQSRVRAVVTELRPNEPAPESTFRLVPEPGESVTDNDAKKTYLVRADGALDEIDPIGGMPVRADGPIHAPPDWPGRSLVRYGIFPALVILVFGLILLRRRRGRTHKPTP